MAYSAHITYSNDLGQLYAKNINFNFDAKPNHIEFKLKGDTIRVDHFTMGKGSTYDSLQLVSYRNNEVIDTKTINAPYREKIDLFNTSYVLKDRHGKEIDRITINTNNYIPVSLSGERDHNSVRVELNNDLQMPVSYQVFKRDQKVAGGQWQKGDSPIIYTAIDSSLDDYHVLYSVVWRGKFFIKEQMFYNDETKLNVNIKQPDIVFPGSRVPVEINITDYKNKGVEGANITAYAVNDLFRNIPLPSLPYFGRLHDPILYKFNVNQQKFSLNTNDQITEGYLKHFKMRDIPYYNFVYAENGVGIYRDTIADSLTELSVYAHNMSNRIAIRTVYLNDEPVAIDGTSNQISYVFRKPSGTYELRLRTKNTMYTIDNVKLEKGKRTYLCLNEAYIDGNPDVSYLNIDQIPYTDPEWNHIKFKLLYLRRSNNRYILEQNGLVVDVSRLNTRSLVHIKGHNYHQIGPFKKGKINVYDQVRDTITSFDFYPGFEYFMDQHGQIVVDKPIKWGIALINTHHRSQHSDWSLTYKIPLWADYLPDTTKAKPVKKNATVKVPKEPIPEINLDNPARNRQLKTFYPKTLGRPNASNLMLKNNTGKTLKYVVLESKDNPMSNGAWYTTRFNFNRLAPGSYNIMALFTDSSYALVSNFNLRPNGNNYYRLDSQEVKSPDLMLQLKYEDIIVNGNKAPLNVFVNYPLYYDKVRLKTMKSQKGETILSGYLVNTLNQPLEGINLILEKAGEFKYGALTNIDGYFELSGMEPGKYTIKIGNYLPYQVYKDLTVKRGVNTRILIGNDPALQLTKEGELVRVEVEEIEVINEVYSTDDGSPAYNYYQDNVSASYSAVPAYADRAELQAVSVLASKNALRLNWNLPETELESTIYPKLGFEEDPMTNHLSKFAKQKGMDKATLELIRENDSLNRIRENFRDYGYWVPNIVTDAKGNAKFTVQFPDNVTRWKTIVPAMTGNKQTGIGVKYAQAFKPLSGHLGIPTFLVAEDSVQLEGKILNYTNETLSARTWFKLNNDTLHSGQQSTNRTISENQLFSWPEPADSLSLAYGLKMDDGYLDGEQRRLKVLTNGIEQIRADMVLLDKDSVLTLSPDQTKKSIYIYNKPLGIYQTEISKLKRYRYGCNEQTASKLKALLLEEQIAKALEQPFKDQKTIRTCINILTKNQMTDGSYGWWGRSTTDIWVTAYVLDALSKASEIHKVGNYMAAARFLNSNLQNMKVSDRLTSLNTLADLPYPMDYDPYIEALDSINLSLKDEFKLIYLKQQQDSLTDVSSVLESYIEVPEGIFWGESLFGTYIHQWSTSALAYKILKKAGGHDELLTKMRDYFLKLNPEGRNTIQRATLLELFLEDELLVNQTVDEFKGEVWVNDQKITAFPYYQTFEQQDTIRIRKAGTRVNVQVNTHTITKTPQGNDSLLTVNSWFQQFGKQTDTLRTSAPVMYHVNVDVKEDMKYVLMEIPIPASCIYSPEQPQSNPHQSYRESFRHMTAISCARLPKGTHEFKIKLMPRYEGRFRAIPVKVEDMYYPVKVNYSQVRTLTVKKG